MAIEILCNAPGRVTKDLRFFFHIYPTKIYPKIYLYVKYCV